VTVGQSTIIGNSAGSSGGGVFVYDQATLTLGHSTHSGNAAGFGSGISGSVYATLSIDHSTLSGNTAVYAGGGIDIGDYTVLTIGYSTISGNTAYFGGGIYVYNSTASIDHSTLDNPIGGSISGSIYVGTVHLKETVVDGVFYSDQDYA
jgi:hypothetical protein